MISLPVPMGYELPAVFRSMEAREVAETLSGVVQLLSMHGSDVSRGMVSTIQVHS